MRGSYFRERTAPIDVAVDFGAAQKDERSHSMKPQIAQRIPFVEIDLEVVLDGNGCLSRHTCARPARWKTVSTLPEEATNGWPPSISLISAGSVAGRRGIRTADGRCTETPR